MKKLIASLIVIAGTQVCWAETTLKMNFVKEDIIKILEMYSKAANQKFVIDPEVKGSVTLLNPEEVNLKEAFNQISTMLAINGFSYFYQGDVIVIQSTRQVQRSGIPVVTELPPVRPEMMVTWVTTLKHASVANINRDLRILVSKDGEMVIVPDKNQIMISDFTSNLHRVAKILEQVDKPSNLKRKQ